MFSEDTATVATTAAVLLQLANTNRWDSVVKSLDGLVEECCCLPAESTHASSSTPQRNAVARLLSSEHEIRSGNTLAHLAAKADRVDVLERLLRLGVDLRRSTNFVNHSPMQEARNSESEKALTFILENV